jgi:serine/threonine-protein kinase ULK/ATG1
VFGVQIIHENNLVHRDLKPDNILLHRPSESSPYVLKIADFGLTRTISSEKLAQTNCGFVYYI